MPTVFACYFHQLFKATSYCSFYIELLLKYPGVHWLISWASCANRSTRLGTESGFLAVFIGYRNNADKLQWQGSWLLSGLALSHLHWALWTVAGSLLVVTILSLGAAVIESVQLDMLVLNSSIYWLVGGGYNIAFSTLKAIPPPPHLTIWKGRLA